MRKRYFQLSPAVWQAKLAAATQLARPCQLCPRRCRIVRATGKGFCQQTSLALAHWQLHRGEEPLLVGNTGSATFFFEGCNLRCVYCQNYQISRGKRGTAHQLRVAVLAQKFLAAQAQGAANLNLVTPTIYLDQILAAIYEASQQGLRLPIVYNTSSYESLDALAILEDVVDIYLADFKYDDAAVAQRYSQAANYPQVAAQAIRAMAQQVGGRILRKGLLQRGLIIRHLVLPGQSAAAARIAQWVRQHCPQAYFSLLAQYDPPACLAETAFPELQRPITLQEYQDAGRALAGMRGFQQDVAAANDWRPQFDGQAADQFEH